MSNPLIIGITGGIGGGKSTLSDKLRAEGYCVYDSDIEARRLQNEHPVIRTELVRLFGASVYTPQGLNRPELAKMVFGNPELMKKLNEVVHPVVKQDFDSWCAAHTNEQLLFLETAILFESGFIRLVDKVILMTASEEVRIARVIKRDGSTPEQVKARMAHQQPDSLKIPLADYVIYSDDQQPLIDKMYSILNDLKSLP